MDFGVRNVRYMVPFTDNAFVVTNVAPVAADVSGFITAIHVKNGEQSPGDGVIDNLYVALNTPIRIHQPIFSFIDTSTYYIQANFNETDLRRVRVGDKATIMLRMYYFDKIFHGRVVNTLWAAERQKTAAKSQLQLVSNENEWLLLPQRLPIQIEITDPDPHYPLNPGASAYVYISTR